MPRTTALRLLAGVVLGAIAVVPLLVVRPAMASAVATGSVTGIVLDAAGSPVSGACVEISTEPTAMKALSDAQGRFLLEGVLVGSQLITVTACQDDSFVNKTVDVTVESGATVDITLTVEPAGAVALTVADGRTGAPLPKACVSIDGLEVGVTGLDGSFEMRRVPVGSHSLEVWDCADPTRGLAPAWQQLIISAGQTSAAAFTLSAYGSITGTIRDAQVCCGATAGALLAGICLTLDTGATATTDAEGRFGFSDVAPGSHQLSVGSCGTEPSYDVLTTVAVVEADVTTDLSLAMFRSDREAVIVIETPNATEPPTVAIHGSPQVTAHSATLPATGLHSATIRLGAGLALLGALFYAMSRAAGHIYWRTRASDHEVRRAACGPRPYSLRHPTTPSSPLSS